MTDETDIEKAKRLLANGLSLTAAAVVMKLSRHTLTLLLRRAGVGIPSPQESATASRRAAADELRRKREAVIRRMVAAGKTTLEIAAEIGLSEATTERLRRLYGIRVARSVPKGSPRVVHEPRVYSRTESVEAYIAANGVTRCPPAYVAPVMGAEPLAPLPIAPQMSYRQAASMERSRMAARRRWGGR